VVEQIEVTGGRGFQVDTERSHDVVMIRDPAARLAQMASVVSDFDCAWMRFTRSGLKEMVLLGGQRFDLDGTKIVESAERVDYLCLKYDAAQKIYVRN
jgi:hypothetical protein